MLKVLTLGQIGHYTLLGLLKQSAVRNRDFGLEKMLLFHLMSLFAWATPSGVPRDPITSTDWTYSATTESRLLFFINGYFRSLLSNVREGVCPLVLF